MDARLKNHYQMIKFTFTLNLQSILTTLFSGRGKTHLNFMKVDFIEIVHHLSDHILI